MGTLIWQPDTCGCFFSLDRTTGEPIEAVKLCPRHQARTPQDAASFVMAQNREKNKAVNAVAEELGRKPEDIEFFLDNDEVELIVDEAHRAKAQTALARVGLASKLHSMRPVRG